MSGCPFQLWGALALLVAGRGAAADEAADLLRKLQPRARTWLVVQQTDTAPGGKGWQNVSLGFTSPKWDPFIDVVFHAEGGTGYLDDFCLKQLDAK